MFFPSRRNTRRNTRRNISTFCLCAFAVAFSNRTEYSIHAQEAVATATPLPQSVIDPQAKVALKKMLAAYANLRSFSADVSLVGTKGDVPSGAASICWQKPNRFAITFFEKGKTIRTVSDGKTMFRLTGNGYFKTPVDTSNNSVMKALQSSGAGNLILSNIDQMVMVMQQPPTQSLTLSDGSEPGTQVIHALVRFGPNTGVTEFWVVLGKTDHLIRQIKFRSSRDNKMIVASETYSNVRANPLLPTSAFIFTPPAGIKLRASVTKPPQATFFDPRLKVGTTPFAFTAKDLSGETISPAKYKGRVVLFDFWATWCGPCVAEMPTVKAAYAKYHEKGFDVVGISLDQDRAALDSFLKTQNIQWSQIYDGKGWKNDIANQYGVQAIPFTLLIGRDGKIAAVNVRGGELEPAIQAALAKK